MSEKTSKKMRKELKNIHAKQKENYFKDVKKKVKDTYSDIDEKIKDAQKLKKLSWINYLIALLISASLVGVSFLIGIYGLKSIKKVEWVIVGFIIISIVCWLVVGWLKNNNAAKYFNDKRRRYQPTYTDEEAMLKKYRKMIIITSLLLFISWLIVFLVIK